MSVEERGGWGGENTDISVKHILLNKETRFREAPAKKNHVYLGIAQIGIWPPLLRKSGHFVAQNFCRKWENSLNSNFDFGNEYFDSD